mmetsp:Transcript_95121/g.307129  ORF Transcript_95121/g.307129 Transcript_95121/m.307129 type:complete len:259 (-) Transcript_95121:855-1631(-)
MQARRLVLVERLQRLRHPVPHAQHLAAARGARLPVRGLAARGAGLRGRRGLPRPRLVLVGRVRQDLWRRPAAAPPPGRAEPARRRPAVQPGVGGDARLQRGALRPRGLRCRGLGTLGGLQRQLRPRPAEPQPLHLAAGAGGRLRLQRRPRGVRSLPWRQRALPRLQALRLGRVVGVEPLQPRLRRRPAEPRPAHQGRAHGARLRALPAARQGGGRAVQHGVLRRSRLRGRRLGPVGPLVVVLRDLRGRRHAEVADSAA